MLSLVPIDIDAVAARGSSRHSHCLNNKLNVNFILRTFFGLLYFFRQWHFRKNFMWRKSNMGMHWVMAVRGPVVVSSEHSIVVYKHRYDFQSFYGKKKIDWMHRPAISMAIVLVSWCYDSTGNSEKKQQRTTCCLLKHSSPVQYSECVGWIGVGSRLFRCMIHNASNVSHHNDWLCIWWLVGCQISPKIKLSILCTM